MTRRRPTRSRDIDSSDTGGDTDNDTAEQSLTALVADLESVLRATEELPVAPAASVWLGEAHAVAADLTHGPGAESVVHERVGHVHRLLTSAGDPDNDAAAAHVADAVALAETILDRTDGELEDGGKQS